MIYIVWRSDNDDEHNASTIADDEQVVITACVTMWAVHCASFKSVKSGAINFGATRELRQQVLTPRFFNWFQNRPQNRPVSSTVNSANRL